MQLSFFKYHGTGNDFILVDNRTQEIELTTSQIKFLCSRHTGVGSDGLILIEPSEEADFSMNFYNPDASQSFCGNGSRCAVAFAASLGMIENECTFTAIDGLHSARLLDQGRVEIEMRPMRYFNAAQDAFVLDTGSPHHVSFHHAVEEMDLLEFANGIRYSEEYKQEGINVNVVEPLQHGKISMRTYERGVENETLSCGTGVTAAALAYASTLQEKLSKVEVKTRGGNLEVTFRMVEDGQFDNIHLAGPTKAVFKGNMEL